MAIANRPVWGYTAVMTKVQQLEREVKNLDERSLAAFRRWFSKFDADEFDRKIERASRSGKLKKLTDSAIKADKAGKSRPL